ncbi:DUF3040 family protein [Pseudonocardia hierapolitana]|uniref:DUF3040 family protein n=1 Tax=Pseudonocardia hierapolitana TaxID=1128676 RepID=A0A561SJC3_9PSEU|nr:DUF3040 domain-containing protein [Pseudonocardia hierapolitana]TWF74955.1 DUF3040 family protein [Pseudonocardia hierapolitana]
MLSERERQALDEIQHRFVTDDPCFAASSNYVSLGESRYSVQWAYKLPSWAYPTAMVVASASGMVMSMEGAAGGALAFASLATAISMLGWSREKTVRREP